MNLEIRKFEQEIISFVNESAIPIEIKRIVFVEILHQIEKETEKQIHIELEKSQKERETTEQEDGEDE